jgi:glyoxylase-like metal-dependent hydrolase (beta-lactamase superfamily II)
LTIITRPFAICTVLRALRQIPGFHLLRSAGAWHDGGSSNKLEPARLAGRTSSALFQQDRQMTPKDSSGGQTYIATRRVGDAAIHIVSDGELLWAPGFAVPEEAWRQAMPEADDLGRVWLGLNVILIEIGDARIVVDPAMDDPGTGFERSFTGRSTMQIRRSPGLAAALDLLDWPTAQVTHALITHAHGDHYGGVMVEHDGQLHIRFPNARHLLGRADWEGNLQRQSRNTELNRRLGAIDQAGLLELVDGPLEVVPGVQLLATPGETPGHIAVRVHSGGNQLFILGDLFHHRCELEHLDWAPPHADALQSEVTRRRVFTDLATSGALAIAPHEAFPGIGCITASGDHFQWESV